MLEVESLVKIYGEQRAVDNISFSAKPGRVLGFLGPNGAGKSTTMKIACGYISPSEGTVKVCGFDVREQSLEVRKRIGYLPENNPLYLEMYVREFLEFTGRIFGMSTAQIKQRSQELIELTGLSPESKKRIGALSKGYRQRVGLCQALMHNPPVLILDEPTSGLDPNQIQDIRQLIRTVGKEKTVVLSTHIMQEVQAVCDDIVIINKGKIVANAEVGAIKSGFRKVYILEIDREVALGEFSGLRGIERVEQIKPGKFSLISPADLDIRADLSRFVADKGWILLGLAQEKENLEEVFRSLTKSAEKA